MLDKNQKEVLIKFLLEVFKFNFGGLVIGFVIAPVKIHGWVFFVGLLFSFLCLCIAVILAKEEKL